MLGFSSTSNLCMTENVKKLDKQFAELYAQYKAEEYSDKKLKRLIRPVSSLAAQKSWKYFAFKLIFVAVVALSVVGGYYWKPTSRFFAGVTKKFMVNQVLPYYDWTWIWSEDCMFVNPYAVPLPPPPVEYPCEVCQQIKSLQPMSEVNSTDMIYSIYDMEPTVIVDATDDWPAIINSLSLQDVIKMYTTDEAFLDDTDYCTFKTTLNMSSNENDSVVEMLEDVKLMMKAGQDANFTAYWSNCDSESSRALHKHYYQPYFLPGMCEAIMRKNYVLMARSPPTKPRSLLFEIPSGEKGYWIAQIHGTMEILLRPHKSCRPKCKSIKFKLQEGEILNVPQPDFYAMAFRPASKEALAFGVSYNYN